MDSNPNSEQSSFLELQVDQDAAYNLKETSRWTRFISIVGIVGLSIMALTLLLAGSFFIELYARLFPGIEAFTGILVFIIVIVIAIAGFMVYLLLRFSWQVRKGIEMQDKELFNKGLNALQIYFVVHGVLAILGLIGNISNLTRL